MATTSRPPDRPPRSAATPPSKLFISTSRPTSSKNPMSCAMYGARWTMLGGVTAPPKTIWILSVGLVAGLVATGPGVTCPAAAAAGAVVAAATADAAGLAAAAAVGATVGAAAAGFAVAAAAGAVVGAAAGAAPGTVGAGAGAAHAPSETLSRTRGTSSRASRTRNSFMGRGSSSFDYSLKHCCAASGVLVFKP